MVTVSDIADQGHQMTKKNMAQNLWFSNTVMESNEKGKSFQRVQ